MSERRIPQATQLVDLALNAGVHLFHSPEGDPYVVLEAQGHRETWLIASRSFRLWLQGRYYTTTKGTPNAQATQDAIGVLESRARYDGTCEPVFTRVAEHQGGIYLDLADEAWRVVAITADGWTVRDEPSVRFRRPQAMRPLPLPERGGRLDLLRELVNLDDDGWILVAGWLLGTLRPNRPHAVLGIHGEQGTGKSNQGAMLRGIVDPNTADLRSPPREEIDLVLAAVNGWIVGYDNVSSLPEWLTDALCRLSTGAGLSRRLLYTNDEEKVFAVKRPVIFTAITEIAVRGDLCDRTIAVTLPRFTAYRTEDALWSAFYAARPRILGALLDAAAVALRNVGTTSLVTPPRMADFATWVVAGEPGLGWKPGTFLGAYDKNRESSRQVTLEASAIGQAVLTFMRARSDWKGNAKQLLGELEGSVDEATRRDRHWPQGEGGPRALGGKLRAIAPDLRAVGLDAEFHERLGSLKRQWTLSWSSQDARGPADGPGTVGANGKTPAHSSPSPGGDGRDGELLPFRSEGDICWQCGEQPHAGAC